MPVAAPSRHSGIGFARASCPAPLPGTHRYDRHAIDAALDRLSGLAPTIAEISEYEAWKHRRENTG